MTTNRPVHVDVSELTQRFVSRQGEIVALEGVTFSLSAGEFVCLLGPSGCGKTSLLRILAGLQDPTQGSVRIEHPRHEGVTDFAMVLQEHGLFPWMSLARNISFPLQSGGGLAKDKAIAIAMEHLARVGLESFADHYPHQVSGGMKQRVSVARSFAMQPALLLMDEPFVFLDYQTRLSLHSLLLDLWHERQTTVFFVTHDIEEAVALADRVLVMSKRPGTLKADMKIDLPRPRAIFELRGDARFGHYVSQLTQMIREEMADVTSQ